MHSYTGKQIVFLSANARDFSRAELTALFNRRFNLQLSQQQISSTMKRYGILTGRDGRFQPGQQSHNKGKKGYCAPGAEKGWFKPGQVPKNYKPIGTERINADGYVDVKIADPNKWRQKHLLIWEEAHGPVPDGHVVIFGDGNKLNVQLDNLILITRSQLVRLNQLGLIGASVELTKAGITVADLHIKIAERRRNSKKKARIKNE